MSFKMQIVEDTINLQTLINATDEVGEKIMQKCASVLKVRVQGNLKSLQKTHFNKKGYPLKRTREVHMSDDVVIKTGKDKYGYRFAKVQGGKQTGTLWHLVNDGTFSTSATHFMDNAISEVESEIEMIINQELGRTIENGN